jgi:hypothetical protein
MSDIFGFSLDSNTSDFLPILKFDARAGTFIRVDREPGPDGQFVSTPVVLAYDKVKFAVDFENAETGWLWLGFGPPSMALVSLEKVTKKEIALPPKPTPDHKNGIRLVVKLSPGNAAGKPAIRELASSAKAFMRGVAPVYRQYLDERDAHPGMLPVLMQNGPAAIEKSGQGKMTSTNYRPVLKISGWVERGDLKPQPRGNGATAAAAANGGEHEATDDFGLAPPIRRMPPDTGASRASAPSTPPDFEDDIPF